MSQFSGKCDLFQHLSGLGGWFDVDGNPVTRNDPNAHGPLYSDELKDFEAFKKETSGIIYQHHKVEVNKLNQNFVKEHCKQFDFKEVEGTKKNQYIYIYWGKEYTLKELNKKGVYIEVEIHFNTLLDLIPYYPYICYGTGEKVIISNESYVDEQFKDHLQYGWISELDYKKTLQKHYLEVCKKYFLYKLEERTNIEEIIDPIININTKENKTTYCIEVKNNIDYMHDIEFVWNDEKIHTHWASPKLLHDNIIELSKEDVEFFLKDDIKNGTVKIKYVEKCEFPWG